MADADSPPRKRGHPLWSESIERGKACLPCRTRKLKCDGVRPACSACVKRRRHDTVNVTADDPAGLDCVYEDREPGEKVRRVSRKQIQTLESRITELEAQLANWRPSLAPPPSASASAYPRPAMPPLHHVSAGVSPTAYSSVASPGSSSVHSSTPSTSLVSEYKSPPVADFASFGGSLLATGYSPDLPPPITVKRIVDLYMLSKHPCTSMFDPTALRTRLDNPPTHGDYPHAALLHAMIALVVDLHGEDVLLDHKLPDDMAPGVSLAQWHATRAKTAADNGALSCDRFFDIVQAVVLLSIYSYRICRFQDIWHLTGIGARVAVALRLNKVPVYSPTYDWEYCAYTNVPIDVVRLPKSHREVTDRRMAFWWTYVGERFAAANTGWAMMIQDEDVGTLLPSASPARSDDPDDWRHMHLGSSEFFLSHPPHLVGGLQLFFKAAVLLGRAAMTSRKLPRFNQGRDLPKTAEQARATPAFLALERNIGEYLRSTAKFLANHSENKYTPFIASMPHVARILAHEPLCGSSLSDVSLVLCTDAARRILSNLGNKNNAGVAAELLPFLTFCWTIAGRVLIRQVAVYKTKEMDQAANQMKQEVEVLLQRLRYFKNANTENAVAVLSSLMSNFSVLLPLGMQRTRQNSNGSYQQSPVSSQASPPTGLPTPVSMPSPLPTQGRIPPQANAQVSSSLGTMPPPPKPSSVSSATDLRPPCLPVNLDPGASSPERFGPSAGPGLSALANFPLPPTAPSSLAAARRHQLYESQRISSAPASPRQGGPVSSSPFLAEPTWARTNLLDSPVPSSSHLLTGSDYVLPDYNNLMNRDRHNFVDAHSNLPTPPHAVSQLPGTSLVHAPASLPVHPHSPGQSSSFIAPSTTAAMASTIASTEPVLSLDETKQRLAQLHAEDNVRRLDVAVGMGSGIGSLASLGLGRI
ncbi:hypothetical protein OIV83_001160 [Microbotryomycetes sp. JL201]|nr:hypothetical protein OIV83_001160 [Microbotryomycetes sp. JL201]